MCRAFVLLLCLQCSVSWASWQDIAYDKRFDELKWNEILSILSSEKKFDIISGVINEHKSELTEEDFQFYLLISEVGLGKDINTILKNRKSLSSRESVLRLEWLGEKKAYLEILQELTNIKSDDLTVKIIKILIEMELWDLAELKYKLVVKNPKIYSFQVLELLELIKKKSEDRYLRFLEIFKVMRPGDELGRQLWVESVFSLYPYLAWQSLNEYCLGAGRYCYNSIELGRQLGFVNTTSHNMAYLLNRKEYLKVLLHQSIDRQAYLTILQHKAEIQEQGLLEDARYAYALLYAAYFVGDCQSFGDYRDRLKNQRQYIKRVEQLEKRCSGTF